MATKEIAKDERTQTYKYSQDEKADLKEIGEFLVKNGVRGIKTGVRGINVSAVIRYLITQGLGAARAKGNAPLPVGDSGNGGIREVEISAAASQPAPAARNKIAEGSPAAAHERFLSEAAKPDEPAVWRRKEYVLTMRANGQVSVVNTSKGGAPITLNSRAEANQWADEN